MPNSLWPHGQQHVYHLQAMLNQYISQLQTSSCQGGWQLSRRIPPSSLERNELKQLLKTQRKGCSLPELTCHGHGLLVSPKLLTTQVCEPEHSEVKQNETGKNKTKKKGLLQSQARRMSGLCSKSSDSMMVCGRRCYRQNMRWSFRECGFILTG